LTHPSKLSRFSKNLSSAPQTRPQNKLPYIITFAALSDKLVAPSWVHISKVQAYIFSEE